MGRQRTVIQVGMLRIDRLRFEVTIRGMHVRLTRKEFELLWMLASETGRVFHRNELIEQVWGSDYYIHGRAVDVHITQIRNKLKDAASDLSFIETVWGIGYRFKDPEAVSD
jgi:DNA-binding response OmpR family regulator